MKYFLFLAAPLIQGLLMTIDEFYYHQRRGLPRWERVGHPLDTFTLIVPCWVMWLWSPQQGVEILFIVLAIFSCAVVSKDEWVHRRYCSGGEQWIHSLLFLIHPVVFFSLYWIWPWIHTASVVPDILPPADNLSVRLLAIASILRSGFLGFMFMTHLFLIYQIVYWNFIYRGEPSSETSS